MCMAFVVRVTFEWRCRLLLKKEGLFVFYGLVLDFAGGGWMDE